eukprot:COSAG02_NODE_14395_length_1277_cov_0.968591_2_plen_164_part_00
MLCGTHAAMVLLSCRYRKSWIYKAMWVGGSATSECISAPELAWKKRMFPSADPAKWQYITTPSFPTLQQIRECVISDFYSDTGAWGAGWRESAMSDIIGWLCEAILFFWGSQGGRRPQAELFFGPKWTQHVNKSIEVPQSDHWIPVHGGPACIQQMRDWLALA